MKSAYFQSKTQMQKFRDEVFFYNTGKNHTKPCNNQLRNSFFKIMKKINNAFGWNAVNKLLGYNYKCTITYNLLWIVLKET